ncbi:MAG TPA: ABC transporter permease [Haloplasmataceae bacterium]
MSVTRALVTRNIRIFLRCKSSVFFSFLSIIIIISLYALFLGDVQVQNIKNFIPNGIEIKESDLSWLVNSWIMAGIISVNTVTTTLGTYGTIVEDIAFKTNKDFLSSPIKRSQVVLGYIISSWILAIMFSIVGFLVFEFYIVIKGGHLLSLIDFIKVILIIGLSVIIFSGVLFYIVSFIKSPSTYGTLSTIVGTLIGFLAGIYIPPAALPKYAQVIISLFPVSYSASLLRRVVMPDPLNTVFKNAGDLAIREYSKDWGVVLYIGNYEINEFIMIIALLVIGFAFYLLSILRVMRNKI